MISSVRRIRSPLWVAVVASALSVAHPLAAQEPPVTAQDSLRAELRRLRAAAEAAAAAAAQPTSPAAQQVSGGARALQALNPEISVNADIFAHLDPDQPGADNFFAREFEISLVSNLDPFSRAKVFIGRHIEGGEIVPFGGHGHEGEEGEEEGGHGGEFAIEEGYVEWVGLPGGLGLKLGRFYQQLGQVNRWHPHAFLFQSRPLPHLAILGEEGLGQTGASLRWLAPFGGAAGTYEATVEVTRSENETLFGAATRPSVLGHVNGFWQMGRATDLDLGVSWVRGRYEDAEHVLDRNVYSAEASLTWRPPERAKYRGFNLRGGVLVLDGVIHEEDDEAGDASDAEDHEEGPRTALGFWTWGELRLNQSWLAGARYEWTENPAHPEESAWLFSPTLTWWQSEYVRIRAEYDLLGRTAESGKGRFLLQVTFAMGPHKHESY
ncbi:MAG TPA: hypothetical protein VLH75_03005 [Longimicrobiales bacterium]|nr:hypothetical protein [Longimicrobiales bacterium]